MLTAIILGGQPMFADNLPVVNPDFQTPLPNQYVSVGGAGSSAIPGWTISGGGSAGVWNVVDYGGSGLVTAPPGGSTVGFIDGNGVTTVSQTLTTDLQPNTAYTLQIDVSGRSDGFGPGTDYSVGLYAGGTLLTAVTPETPEYGSWDVLTAAYTSGANVPSDVPLTVEISSPGIQFLFDNVVVDPDNADRIWPTPDGGTTAMLLGIAMAGMGWLRRKI